MINATAEKIKRNREVVKMKELGKFVSFVYFVNTIVSCHTVRGQKL